MLSCSQKLRKRERKALPEQAKKELPIMKQAHGIIFTILALVCAGYLIFCYNVLGRGISAGLIPAVGGIVLAWIAGKLCSADEIVTHRGAVAHG